MIDLKTIGRLVFLASLLYENSALAMDEREKSDDNKRGVISVSGPGSSLVRPPALEEPSSSSQDRAGSKGCCWKCDQCWEKTKRDGCSRAACHRLGKNTCTETSRFFICMVNFLRCRGWQWRK